MPLKLNLNFKSDLEDTEIIHLDSKGKPKKKLPKDIDIVPPIVKKGNKSFVSPSGNQFADVYLFTPTFARKMRESKQKEKLIVANRTYKLMELEQKILKHSNCEKIDKIIGIGGFGVVGFDKNDNLIKIIINFVSKYIKSSEKTWEFMFNRYKNFCKETIKYTKETNDLFPNNFIKIKTNDCGFCSFEKKKKDKDNLSSPLRKNKIPAIFLKMKTVKNLISINLKKILIDKILSKEEIYKIYVQLYYIIIKTNNSELYHNDMKPPNILIQKSPKDFDYKGLTQNGKEIILSIKKNEPIPIIIDYDLCSFKKIDEYHPADGSSSDDFLYLITTTNKYVKYLKSNPIFELEHKSNKFNIEKTYEVFKNIYNDKVKLINLKGGGVKYNKMKVQELKKICSKKKIKGYSKLNKKDLIKILEKN